MTPEEAERASHWTANMSTRCIGRYLIDLPAAFVLNSQSEAKEDDVDIKVTPMTREDFDLLLQGRKKFLEAAHMFKKPDWPFLRRTISVPDRDKNAIEVIFDRAENEIEGGRLNRVLELWGWRNGFTIGLTTKAWDNTFPEDAGEKWAHQFPSNISGRLAAIQHVYNGIEGLPLGEIPKGPGMCIANGFVKGAAVVKESVGVAFHLDGVPDVYFAFDEKGSIRERTTMLERAGQIQADYDRAGAKTLRKGKRSSDEGLHFEEWLVSGPTPDHVNGAMFQLQANAIEKEVWKPYITLTLFNGFEIPKPSMSLEERRQKGLLAGLQKATLSDAEGIAIWDKVTATLRPRVGAF
jgi:hypothetical protein